MNIFGPEYNWLIDIRHVSSPVAEQRLNQYIQPGDNTAIVTSVTPLSNAITASLATTCTIDTTPNKVNIILK